MQEHPDFSNFLVKFENQRSMSNLSWLLKPSTDDDVTAGEDITLADRSSPTYGYPTCSCDELE